MTKAYVVVVVVPIWMIERKEDSRVRALPVEEIGEEGMAEGDWGGGPAQG